MPRGGKRPGAGRPKGARTKHPAAAPAASPPDARDETRPEKKDARRLEIRYRPLAELQRRQKNPRTHSKEQVAQIAAAMGEFGFTNPILLDERGEIIAGHGRLEAALKAGYAEAPTITLDGLSEDQKRALVVADNKLALNAGWDMALLRDELAALQNVGFDMDLVGFSDGELDALFAPKGSEGRTDPDDAPDVQARHVSEPGDVWVLGRHRVMCGSAEDMGQVDALMDGEPADLVWTDPPYNVAYEGAAGSIANDDMSDEAFRQFLQVAFSSYFAAARPGACIYVAHADSEGYNFRGALEDAGWKLSQCLVWVKNAATLSRQDYNWQHEPVLYGWKEGAAHYFCADYTKTTVLAEAEQLHRLSREKLVALVDRLRTIVRSTVTRHEKPSRAELHPTMKPVALVQEQIEASSKAGWIVADFFGGSGTTLIACERSGRTARLMELSPKFVDVIVRRWQAFTGQAAVLEGDGRTFAEVEAEAPGEAA